MSEVDAGQTNTDTSVDAAAEATVLEGAAGQVTEADAADAAVTPAESAAPGEGEAAPADPTPAVVIPENYDFSAIEMPEGMVLDEALVASAAPVLKELNLTQEQANKLATLLRDQRVADAASEQQRAADTRTRVQSGWVQQLKADELVGGSGGEEFERNCATAALAVQRYGDEDTVRFLESSGLGSHPGMVRMMLRMGKELGLQEDSLVTGQAGTTAPPLLNRLYGPGGSAKAT